MPQTYTNGFEFTAVSGEDTCVELPAPPRGEVTRLSLKQINGALAGFTAKLLDRVDACAANAEISSSFEPDTPEAENKLLDPDMHRILPAVVVSAASDLSEQFNLTAGYQNRNEQDIRRTPDSRIYLDINPDGTGSKLFQVSYSVTPRDW